MRVLLIKFNSREKRYNWIYAIRRGIVLVLPFFRLVIRLLVSRQRRRRKTDAFALESHINWLRTTQESIGTCLAAIGQAERIFLLLDTIDNISPLPRTQNLLKTEEAWNCEINCYGWSSWWSWWRRSSCQPFAYVRMRNLFISLRRLWLSICTLKWYSRIYHDLGPSAAHSTTEKQKW